MSSELNDIHNDMASQVFDVTIPLNFLVTEAGQLKVHSSYIGDKCFFSKI
jgi:DnaJ homolog subfamily C member 11